jgi:predicted SAM-dependent methyltransferase
MIGRNLKNAIKRAGKELVFSKNHILGLKRWFSSAQNAKKDFLRVQVGGGEHVLKGFLNIDIARPADLICDVREGMSLPSGSAELIFAEHFLEHIDYPRSVKRFIKECYRILKPKGKLVIGVPDAGMMIKAYLRKDRKFYRKILKKWYSKRYILEDIDTYIDLVNIHLRDENDSDKYSPHLWAYDEEKLVSLFRAAGFGQVSRWKFDTSIANPKRKFGSIYLEAVK